MKLPNQDITQWKKSLAQALWFLGEHAFATTLALVLLAAGIAAVLFFQYVIFTPQAAEEAAASEFEFRQELFFEVLRQLQEESERLEGADEFQARDLFNP